MRLFAAATIAFTAILLPTASDAQESTTEWIVSYEPGTAPAEKAEAREDAGASLDHRLKFARTTEVVEATKAEASELRNDPNVVSVVKDSVVSIAAVSDDQYAEYLWPLENVGQIDGWVPDADIDGAEAWQINTGAGSLVAVVDTCVDYRHPELVDRYAGGYDFYDDDPDPGCTIDDHDHGSHVAGSILATRNNGIGIAGVAPDAKLLALRVLGADGRGMASDIIDAFAYAGQAGAAVVNASLAGQLYTDPGYGPVARLYPQTLYVAAASNDGTNNDAIPYYPANADAPNLISVGATDAADKPASFSNYGATTVDLHAPGVSILSLGKSEPYPYGFNSGTSMAAPHVSGAAALLKSHLGLSGEANKERLMATAEPKPALAGLSVTGARLNAVLALGSPAPPPSTTTTTGAPTTTTTAPTTTTTAQPTTTTTVEPTTTTTTPQKCRGNGRKACTLLRSWLAAILRWWGGQ